MAGVETGDQRPSRSAIYSDDDPSIIGPQLCELLPYVRLNFLILSVTDGGDRLTGTLGFNTTVTLLLAA